MSTFTHLTANVAICLQDPVQCAEVVRQEGFTFFSHDPTPAPEPWFSMPSLPDLTKSMPELPAMPDVSLSLSMPSLSSLSPFSEPEPQPWWSMTNPERGSKRRWLRKTFNEARARAVRMFIKPEPTPTMMDSIRNMWAKTEVEGSWMPLWTQTEKIEEPSTMNSLMTSVTSLWSSEAATSTEAEVSTEVETVVAEEVPSTMSSMKTYVASLWSKASTSTEAEVSTQVETVEAETDVLSQKSIVDSLLNSVTNLWSAAETTTEAEASEEAVPAQTEESTEIQSTTISSLKNYATSLWSHAVTTTEAEVSTEVETVTAETETPISSLMMSVTSLWSKTATSTDAEVSTEVETVAVETNEIVDTTEASTSSTMSSLVHSVTSLWSSEAAMSTESEVSTQVETVAAEETHELSEKSIVSSLMHSITSLWSSEESAAPEVESDNEEHIQEVVNDLLEDSIMGKFVDTVGSLWSSSDDSNVELVEESVQEIIDETVEEIIDETVEEIVEESVEEIVEESVEEIVEESVHEIVEESVEEIIEEIVEDMDEDSIEDIIIEEIEEVKEEIIEEIIIESDEELAQEFEPIQPVQESNQTNQASFFSWFNLWAESEPVQNEQVSESEEEVQIDDLEVLVYEPIMEQEVSDLARMESDRWMVLRLVDDLVDLVSTGLSTLVTPLAPLYHYAVVVVQAPVQLVGTVVSTALVPVQWTATKVAALTPAPVTNAFQAVQDAVRPSKVCPLEAVQATMDVATELVPEAVVEAVSQSGEILGGVHQAAVNVTREALEVARETVSASVDTVAASVNASVDGFLENQCEEGSVVSFLTGVFESMWDCLCMFVQALYVACEEVMQTMMSAFTMLMEFLFNIDEVVDAMWKSTGNDILKDSVSRATSSIHTLVYPVLYAYDLTMTTLQSFVLVTFSVVQTVFKFTAGVTSGLAMLANLYLQALPSMMMALAQLPQAAASSVFHLLFSSVQTFTLQVLNMVQLLVLLPCLLLSHVLIQLLNFVLNNALVFVQSLGQVGYTSLNMAVPSMVAGFLVGSGTKKHWSRKLSGTWL